MFLFVMLLLSNLIQASNHAPDKYLSPCKVNVAPEFDLTKASESIEEELCETVLSSFMKKTDSNLTKYIKPHLVSIIKEATSSPDSDDDSPSPKKIVRKLASNPAQARIAPKQELDEVVLAAVQKAFEEKEALLEKKSAKIDRMFSKKATLLISAGVSIVLTLTGTLTGTLTTSKDCNCTK